MLAEPWQQALAQETRKLYFQRLERFIRKRRKETRVLPSAELTYRAFDLVKPDKVKVVIVGQEPYGVSNGLAFSVPKEQGIPPTLSNIFKELKADIGCPLPNHGDLIDWSNRGILLLNSVLTTEQDSPLAHANMGWERFTDYVISWLNLNKEGIVFMLWGVEALKKEPLIKDTKHLIIKTTHPSPFSAHLKQKNLRAFLGSKPFSEANRYLIKNGRNPIDWTIKNRV